MNASNAPAASFPVRAFDSPTVAAVEGGATKANPDAGKAAWPAWQRFVFRYLAIHWLLYAFPRPLNLVLSTLQRGIREVSPWFDIDAKVPPWRWPGKWASELGDVDRWWQSVTTWLWQHGLSPVEIIHQRTGSGDTAHDWLQCAVIVAVSLTLATIWTLLARATHYPRLGRVLHLLVRFDLAFHMLGYGFAKFYGGQFGDLSLFRLTQEIGDTTPMGMVGTFMQASKPYELFGGAGEVLAGLLLFHRRTALLGAFVAIAVMANVCALNWLYGVPVKLYSTHLLLYAVFLLAPYQARLWSLFVSNRPSQPVDLAVTKSRWLGWPLAILGTAWVLGSLASAHFDRNDGFEQRMKGREKSALYGLWQVETMLLDGQEVPVTDATRWRHLAIDRGRLAWAQEATGKRVFFEFDLDAAATTAKVKVRAPGPAASPAAPVAEPETWTCETGKKTVPVDVPLLLRMEDRGRKVDGERRTLVVKGKLGDKQLELRTVEKVFRLQTGFRLRQELPEGW